MKYLLFILLNSFFILNIYGQDSYLPVILETEKWINNAAQKVKNGKNWLWCPDSLHLKDYQPTTLYHGSSGVVLFYLELYAATGNKKFLKEAKLGAQHLINTYPDTIPSAWQVGFYTGTTGISYTLEQVYKASKKKKYRDYAIKYLDLSMKAATPKGEGIEWGGVNEIVYGSAGVGLYLIYAFQEMEYQPAKEWAVKAGLGLLANQKEEKEGSSWLMGPGYENHIMPNFSHGTAGVSYYLLRLYEMTGQQQFLEAALKGSEHLESLINEEGLIYRTFPSAQDIYYLGWCHGIAGTARLYFKLYEITGDEKWMNYLHQATKTTMTCGIPEKQTSGFWNNVSQCCGNAGLAQYYLEIYSKTGKQEYLDFSEMMTQDLIRRSDRNEDGRRWIQAENRTQPHNLMAQTSYMQGAAGIGIWLLKLEAFKKRREVFVRFPDNPFE